MPRFKRFIAIPLITATAALLLAGCTQEPSAQMTPDVYEPPAAARGTGDTGALPLSSYYTTVDAPGIDGHASATGEIAHPSAEGAPVYDSASGKPIALLSATESVPVIERSDGWVRVLLPSRRSLPDKPLRPTVNGATGWIEEGDLEIQKADVRLLINMGNERLDVITHNGGKVIASFPATIGADVPRGPTYIAPGIGVTECSVAPLKLSAQSDHDATYRGQPFSPTFIGSASSECAYTPKDAADMIPRMVQIAPEHLEELTKIAPAGTFIDIVVLKDGTSGAPKIEAVRVKDILSS